MIFVFNEENKSCFEVVVYDDKLTYMGRFKDNLFLANSEIMIGFLGLECLYRFCDKLCILMEDVNSEAKNHPLGLIDKSAFDSFELKLKDLCHQMSNFTITLRKNENHGNVESKPQVQN